MMSKILTIVGIILSFGGTFATLLMVITTSEKYVGTCNEMANRHADFAKEKKWVIAGAIFLCIGAILQILGVLL